ncbi:multicopper oxidase domain-containing protein [Pedobacter sp. BS3]|nr:multicopper oxidase domain-containing protein [Pedobacter sp. BS3]
MHPEVTSDKPGKCPKCGMKLEKTVHAGHHEEEHQHLPAAVFDRGNNQTYKPFSNFAVPVAKPTPADAPVPVTVSNSEADIQNKPVEAARAGIHFPKGTIGAKTVRYDLYVTDSTVNYTGKKRKGIAVNGSIPAPTLVFTVGDTALIYVHNNADEPTAVHWHGVFLSNRMDGVPYLTQMPIAPHTTYVYKFPVVQDGTYWYHSHFSLQEQIGLYGALIFNKRTEPDIPTIPVVLSDWSDMKPKEIDRSLHAATDWFAIRKKATQSYSEAIKAGRLGVKLTNEWKRMTAMDVSDVYYERFLLNGLPRTDVAGFKAGEKVRLRLVNGGASTYFWLTYSDGKITVIANDGNDVAPVDVDRLLIAPSETYDVVVRLPQDKKYEFLATAEDRTGYASLWLGDGEEVPAMKLPRLNYFEGMQMMNDMMKLNGDMKPMGHKMSLQKMDMNTVMYPEMDGKSAKDMMTLNYTMLKSVDKTTLPQGNWKELKFELTGNMNRYVWTLDNKTVSESDKILIKQGENIRIILYNNSMMRHPMHLHGHDFRLLNKYGDYSPLKNVVDIMPMETDTLEFAASESGDWFFHCHILYHMMSGMGRVFSYENSPANPEIHHPAMAYKMLKMDDRMFHLMGEAGLQSNGSDGQLMYSNTRWQFAQLWHLGLNARHGYESETTVGRYLGKMQWLMPYIGFDYHYKKAGNTGDNIFGSEERNMFGQTSNRSSRKTVIAGFAYTLPWLVVADARVDGNGKVRFQLGREDIPLTPRLRLDFMVNTDKEYMLGSKYVLAKYWSLGAHYDSDMGLGGGIVFTY